MPISRGARARLNNDAGRAINSAACVLVDTQNTCPCNGRVLHSLNVIYTAKPLVNILGGNKWLGRVMRVFILCENCDTHLAAREKRERGTDDDTNAQRRARYATCAAHLPCRLSAPSTRVSATVKNDSMNMRAELELQNISFYDAARSCTVFE